MSENPMKLKLGAKVKLNIGRAVDVIGTVKGIDGDKITVETPKGKMVTRGRNTLRPAK